MKVTFLKDKLNEFILMDEAQINKIVELGIIEDTKSKKKYRVRRVGHYSIAGYKKDPLLNKGNLDFEIKL